PEAARYLLNIDAGVAQQRRMTMPLRYNNDKREKASIQGVFCVCRCFSIPFPTVDYQRENCREKEAVKVKTKNLKRAFHFSE
ncbi:MAG: hypothetical protein IJR57_03990, partial [Ruminococcus sp.]|nr:hypothetical protein [Ruminococcus sp.]